MNNLDDARFKARRVSRSYCQTIHAEPSIVFPLLCPVREVEWLDGWKYHLIYSESGYAEEGCVFSTPYKGEKDTLWIITKLDKNKHEIQFARFTPDSRTCVLDISVKPKENNISNVYITYTYTAISNEGNQFIQDFTEDKFYDAVRFWEKSMNYFLETGKRLRKINNS
jgi:hypothetical protein